MPFRTTLVEPYHVNAPFQEGVKILTPIALIYLLELLHEILRFGVEPQKYLVLSCTFSRVMS